MKQQRLKARVKGAVERAARKFSPSVRLVLESGAGLDCVASLVVEDAPSVCGAAVGLRASLLFAEEDWASLRTFCPSDAALFNGKFVVDSVEWRLEVEAAPVVWKDRLGVVSVALWRPIIAR